MTVGTVAENIPQTLREADRFVARIRKRRAEDAADKARLEEISAEAKMIRGRMKKRDEANEVDQRLVQAFADAHRSKLVQGEKKSFRFHSGAVGQWYYPSRVPLIVGDNVAAIMRALLRLSNWRDFVEINFKKDYIKEHLEELHEASPTLRRGFRVERNERFRIDT